MKRLVTNLFYVFIILVGLTACEGTTVTEKIIVNNSSSTISVQTTDGWGGDFTGDIVNGNDQLISTWDVLGGNPTAGNPANNITTFIIVNTNGDSLTKDFMLETNWETEVTETSKIPSAYLHRHTFTVTDSDF